MIKICHTANEVRDYVETAPSPVCRLIYIATYGDGCTDVMTMQVDRRLGEFGHRHSPCVTQLNVVARDLNMRGFGIGRALATAIGCAAAA